MSQSMITSLHKVCTKAGHLVTRIRKILNRPVARKIEKGVATF